MRWLLVILQGHIDDSGSEPSSPVFVLAGYVLPAESWAAFSDEWDAELKKLTPKPIAYLHMKELGKDEIDKGQFAGWNIEEIEEKLFGLAKVLNKRQPISLAAHTKWSEYIKFKDRSSRATFIQNPYKALFHEIIRIMYA